MRKLIEQRYVIKQNLLAIVGFLLFCYFSYHAILGERSYIRLMSLEREITKVSASYDNLHERRVALEDRVVRLRPGSLDRDLLEERARYVLGFQYPGEMTIIR
ncbi:MAG: septum formation initiator family protein [Rhodospirillales bacterium]|nr:septum formation initiator family protein [Rhodospirillales bacterium]MCB9995646.1 septum formation initiator family protein [Rhodospirillales bacterium]